MDNRNEQSNKWGDKAHSRIIASLPSGANVAKTKSAMAGLAMFDQKNFNQRNHAHQHRLLNLF
jgi:hypothetical protein